MFKLNHQIIVSLFLLDYHSLVLTKLVSLVLKIILQLFDDHLPHIISLMSPAPTSLHLQDLLKLGKILPLQSQTLLQTEDLTLLSLDGVEKLLVVRVRDSLVV